MLMWCAGNKVAAMLLQPPLVLILVEALARYGWIMSNVQAQRRLSHSVHILALEKITAGTVKTLALSV